MIDTILSRYIAQLFSIFKNKPIFCLEKKDYNECILCLKKDIELVNESKIFIYYK